MDQTTQSLGLKVRLTTDYASAKRQVIDALKAEGFGVLTEEDVKATMKQKLNIDFREYAILGVCNPPLAHRALTAVPDVGLFLPCNVTLAEIEGTDEIEAAFINPLVMKTMFDSAEIYAVADEVYACFLRVVAVLEE